MYLTHMQILENIKLLHSVKRISPKYLLSKRANKKSTHFLHCLEHDLKFNRLLSKTFKQIFKNLKFLPLAVWSSGNLL